MMDTVPKIARHIEKRICMYCGGYTFRKRPVGLWAYCTVHEKWADDDPKKPLPGKQSCDRFFVKGEQS